MEPLIRKAADSSVLIVDYWKTRQDASFQKYVRCGNVGHSFMFAMKFASRNDRAKTAQVNLCKQTWLNDKPFSEKIDCTNTDIMGGAHVAPVIFSSEPRSASFICSLFLQGKTC